MLAFVHIQKTAGQTMRAILRKNFGTRHCDALVTEGTRSGDWGWVKKCYPGLTSLAGHGVKPTSEVDEQFPDARYYTFVRSPLARCLSHYQYSFERGKKLDFPTWMQQNQNLMCCVICGEQSAQSAIDIIEQKFGFVGLQENFNESLLLWKHWAEESQVDLVYQSTNYAKTNVIKQRIKSDPNNLKLVEALNIEDQKLYDYVVQEIYPRQKTAYGVSLAKDLEQFEQRLGDGCNKSWNAILGKVKRNLIYRPGVRDWKADLEKESRAA